MTFFVQIHIDLMHQAQLKMLGIKTVLIPYTHSTEDPTSCWAGLMCSDSCSWLIQSANEKPTWSMLVAYPEARNRKAKTAAHLHMKGTFYTSRWHACNSRCKSRLLRSGKHLESGLVEAQRSKPQWVLQVPPNACIILIMLMTCLLEKSIIDFQQCSFECGWLHLPSSDDSNSNVEVIMR